MSRGLGRVQRMILECLSVEESASAEIIAKFVFHGELGKRGVPSQSMLVSVRRSLAGFLHLELVGRTFDREMGVWKWESIETHRKRQKREKVRERASARARARRDKAFKQREAEANSGVYLLAKILGMLGSDHDAEVLVAAHRAEDQRRKLGMTWSQLLSL